MTAATGWVQQLASLEDLCRRSPSAHNTQPWVVAYRDDEVRVHWDAARALPLSDPSRRDLFLSLGAFVESCLITAADAGLAVQAVIEVDEATRQVARLIPGPARYATSFTSADLEARGCARGPYQPGVLSEELLADLTASLTVSSDVGSDNRGDSVSGGALASVRQVACRDLAALLRAADRWMFAAPDSVTELRQWMRLSPRHPRYHLDGLTYQAMAMTRAEAVGLAALLAPPVYPVLRNLGGPAVLAAASKGLLQYDGSVLVLTGPVSAGLLRPAELTEHGRALLRLWLALGRRGLSVHPLSQLIDCPATARALSELLGLPAGVVPLAVFRAGIPAQPPVRSARLPC